MNLYDRPALWSFSVVTFIDFQVLNSGAIRQEKERAGNFSPTNNLHP